MKHTELSEVCFYAGPFPSLGQTKKFDPQHVKNENTNVPHGKRQHAYARIQLYISTYYVYEDPEW